MSILLNEYGAELISKILVAGSQEEVKFIVNNSLKNLEQNKVNAEHIAGFIDTTITQLETFNPMKKDSKQWSNIKMARIHLQHIKREFELSPGKKEGKI